jgi:hypothetical protein
MQPHDRISAAHRDEAEHQVTTARQQIATAQEQMRCARQQMEENDAMRGRIYDLSEKLAEQRKRSRSRFANFS